MRGGGVANAKPMYPPEASGGYNNAAERVKYLILFRQVKVL